jgi:heavy metal sensor kinase
MFFSSVRAKIILWYMAVLFLTLLVFCTSLYHILQSRLNRDLDVVLLSIAEGVADSIDAYWESEKILFPQAVAPSESFSKISNKNFVKIVHHWLEEQNRNPQLTNFIIQIFDAKGKLIAQSKEFPSVQTISATMLAAVRKGVPFSSTESLPLGAETLPARVLAWPVAENGAIAYIVEAASPLVSVNAVLQHLRLMLFVWLPMTVLLTGFAGIFFAQAALRPVHSMIKTVNQITADQLSLRIDIPDTKDEIKQLADTFNGMLQKLDDTFTAQRQFIQDISHELKTPLTIMRGEIELALKQPRPMKEYETLLQSNLEEVGRIQKVIGDLLLLARFDSGVVHLKPGVIDLAALVKNVFDSLINLAKQKNVSLAFSTDPDCDVNGDGPYLQRVFLNLIENAIKYTPSDGHVDVTVKRTPTDVAITVADTGVGIAENDLPHIFERFYRGTRTQDQAGFGLGLNIAKSIVDANHGEISVTSQVDHGTVFTVTIPCTPAH